MGRFNCSKQRIRDFGFGLALVLGGILGLVSPLTAATSPGGLGLRMELDRGVLPANSTQRAVVKITLDGPPPPRHTARPPVNLALVLDRSGSMAGSKLRKAQQAAIEALRRLNAQDVFGVVVYDHTIQTVVPAQQAVNQESIEGRIRAIRSGGNTALFGGVSQGAAEVRKYLQPGRIPRIVLLSDGIANVGPSSPADLERLGAALIKEGISVTTVGVGTDYNEDLMARLAEASDGNTYFVESEHDLPRIFTAELGDVLSVVAQEINLTIQCPKGVRPLKVIGRKGRIRNGQVEFSLNQIYGNQEKFALVEVEISGARPGETREIAAVRATYRNPFTRQHESADERLMARFSTNQARVEESVNVEVKKDYYINQQAIAQEKAIELFDQGLEKEAVEELRQSVDELKKAGKKYPSAPALMEAAEDLEEQADQIEAEGMTRKKRKILKTESYQIRNQQNAQ